MEIAITVLTHLIVPMALGGAFGLGSIKLMDRWLKKYERDTEKFVERVNPR